MAHIPGSINIPQGNEDEFERRFAKDKEIIVYCLFRLLRLGRRRGSAGVSGLSKGI